MQYKQDNNANQFQIIYPQRNKPYSQDNKQNTLPKLKHYLQEVEQNNGVLNKIKEQGIKFADKINNYFQVLSPQIKNHNEYLDMKLKYNDDEQLIQKQNTQQRNQKSYDLLSSIVFEIRSLRSICKLSNQQSQYLPGMISIKTKESQIGLNERSIGVDLICLIDKSGSMRGEKIKMVKKTLILLLDFLGEQDRLQIITFNEQAQRLTPLKCLTEKNKQYFQSIISQIQPRGLTKISSATHIAFKQLDDKLYRNNVSSIFLLSDGQDREALFEISNQIKHIKQVFTLYTFGFGEDYDAQLMTSICKLKNGYFYFVKDITLLDEYFAHAIGEIVSVIAEQIQINISSISIKPMQDLQISKTYGNMWKQRGHIYDINIPQLASGTRKDFVFEIQIPQIDSKILDHERVVKVLEASLSMKDPISGEIIKKSAALNLTLFNQDENVDVIEECTDVYSQYLRVKSTETIDNAKQACDQNNFVEAQRLLDNMMIQIQKNNHKVVQKCTGIIQDINQAKQASQKIQYNTFGSKQLCQMIVNNYAQGGINSIFSFDGKQLQQLKSSQFLNLTQQTMIKIVQTKKAQY
ncbi:unnamed protein product [Paramecium pentaurelia]|uniref:VWFA domain-containing protein n=1 Tax=Paramecium pentaurelia TaxID=43138 RepID=A0A8S1XUQ7_9CILI|nr:unnamed protein product [Paramecium pentaurelia]